MLAAGPNLSLHEHSRCFFNPITQLSDMHADTAVYACAPNSANFQCLSKAIVCDPQAHNLEKGGKNLIKACRRGLNDFGV